jgi:hypothetical protein
MEINDVSKYINYKKLPLVTIFGRKVEYEKEFIDLHRDMYALLPYDKAKFFLSSIPEIWSLN